MDDTNTQVDVDALRAALIAQTDEIALRSNVISEMAKSDIQKIEASASPVSEEEIDTDEEAIAEIEAYAEEQLAQFDAQLDEAIMSMEADDALEEAALNAEPSEDEDEDEDKLSSVVQ